MKKIAKQLKPVISMLVCFVLLTGCATSKIYIDDSIKNEAASSKEISHSFYLLGGYRADQNNTNSKLLKMVEKDVERTKTPRTVLFMGDYGEDADASVEQQAEIARLADNAIFLLGDEEWSSKNVDTINRLQKDVESLNFRNVTVETENTCPIERNHINDDLDIIIINSTWLLTNHDDIEGINRNCPEIISRRQFSETLLNYINDGQDKNILIAMHHPIFSNGKYGGEYTLVSQLLPLPIVGSILTGFQNLAAVSNKYLNSNRYNYYEVLLSFLAQESDRITFVSGHEESLQYLKGQNGTPQIISGSMTGKTPTRRTKSYITTQGGSLEYEGQYTQGENGYARLDYYSDGSSQVTFITKEKAMPIAIMPPLGRYHPSNETFEPTSVDSVSAAIVDDKNISDKSAFYRFLWGKRYRDYFTRPITASVARLDTLHGGLRPVKEGGGHQSYSLRLFDDRDRQYAMRSLDKNTLRILKFNLYGAAYNLKEYEGTFIEGIIDDFFTTSNPYLILPIGPLSRAAKVAHSFPYLYYVPKQNTLEKYNDTFGDALYFLEERPSDNWIDYQGYNLMPPEPGAKIDKFESTEDMLQKLNEDESYTVDERAFVRARLFDMLLGDWDRHADQYRWAEYKISGDDKRFVCIPRDRDNAFPKFDGVVIPFLKWFTPLLRSWQSYEPRIKNLKWLNDKGNLLDNVLVTKNGRELWIQEAKALQASISEDDIDRAFLTMPIEVRDNVSEAVKESFKQRLKDLPEYAEKYGKALEKRVILSGTDKDDIIEIERLTDGKTKIVFRRNLSDDPNKIFYERTFEKKKTNEIWIYGLNDTDKFIVTGKGDHEIFIRLAGGYGEDIYQVENNNRIKVYDYKYEVSDFSDLPVRKQLTNQFSANTLHWRNYEENHNIVVPTVGHRTNDGLTLGATDIYTVNGFNGDPFRQQHTLMANYYSIVGGYDVGYEGIFANIFPQWNFVVEGFLTNNRYSTNFFGLGNESTKNEDELGRDYYRSIMRQYSAKAGIAFHTLKISALYENYKIDESLDRIFNPANVDERVFQSQSYVGGDIELSYQNDDANDFPTRAFQLKFNGGYKQNMDISKNHFGYAELELSLAKKLIPSGNLVLATTLGGKTNFGDNFFYYHGAYLGGNNGLRGFRDERFIGKSYFYQSSDLRLRLAVVKTGVLPVTVGLFGGFDYGRVWLSGDTSQKWHTSQGGGVWFSGLHEFGLSAGYFNSVEGNIIQIGFGFGF